MAESQDSRIATIFHEISRSPFWTEERVKHVRSYQPDKLHRMISARMEEMLDELRFDIIIKRRHGNLKEIMAQIHIEIVDPKAPFRIASRWFSNEELFEKKLELLTFLVNERKERNKKQKETKK